MADRNDNLGGSDRSSNQDPNRLDRDRSESGTSGSTPEPDSNESGYSGSETDRNRDRAQSDISPDEEEERGGFSGSNRDIGESDRGIREPGPSDDAGGMSGSSRSGSQGDGSEGFGGTRSRNTGDDINRSNR